MTENNGPKYKSYSINNFLKVDQFREYLEEQDKRGIEVVGNILPFKINNYVIEELIDWEWANRPFWESFCFLSAFCCQYWRPVIMRFAVHCF